ncbi:enoyl-CoA hydratase/isomerase family protein [bacterium]|nr:enoyl-CoA hydratase/isomerase family protein [bacterium]
MSNLVLYSSNQAVGLITLNRPEAMNTASFEMAEAFLEAVEAAQKDEQVRVIVLRGAGKVFCAGGDIKAMQECVNSEDRAGYFRKPVAKFCEMVLALRNCPKPVVAAVHGAAAGYGFNLMLACDFILAEEQTRFVQAFIKIALTPDGGGTWFLPRLVGYQRACEIVMLPTEISSQKALQMGLVNWVEQQDRFEEKLHEVTAHLVSSPLEALARAKALLNQAYSNDLETQLYAEQAALIAGADSPDFAEGLQAFLEKRKPNF